MRKRILSLVLSLVMVISVMPMAAFAESGEQAVSGNLLKVTEVSDFNAGTMENLDILSDVGNGAVTLADGATAGTFVSAIYNTDTFETVVASWNASIYDGSEVEIWARVRQNGEWSDWLSWGPYSPFISRGSTANKGGSLATLKDDIFTIDDGTADGVQLKAEIRRDSADVESPILRQVTASFSGGEMVATYAEEALDELPLEVLNTAPAYAQGIRHPSIGGSICSPTTMTVMMNSRVPSLDLLPEELALNVQDNGEGIFGNWSFSVSGAGLYGFESYYQYASLEIIMQELAQGRPVGIGVSYSPSTTGSYPYLEGSYGSTGGHLITLIGYEYEDGIRDEDHLYFYSSDTYSAGDATSYHRYKWTQLNETWSRKSTYIIPSLEQEDGADVAGVVRVSGALEVSESDRTEFTFVNTDGEALNMDRFTSGGGLLGYTVEGFYTDMENDLVDSDCSVIYPNSMQVTANNTFYYDITCNDDGTLKIDTNAILEKLEVPYGEHRDITVYAFSDRGYLYIATIDATIIADEVVVTPSTVASSTKVESVIYADLVESSVTANDVEGDEVTLGLLIPADTSADQAVVTVDGEIAENLGVYTNEDGASYLEIPVSADAAAVVIVVDWSGEARTYEISLAGVNKSEDVVTAEGNVVSIDLENGRINGNLTLKDGALVLADGEDYAEYYSPVYDTFDWEYSMAVPNAYVPGNSSVDLQIRAYTQRGECWSDWYSFGKLSAGSPATSISMKDTNVNMNTDVFTMRGDSEIANALRWQVRLIIRGNELGDEQPAVHGAYVTFKKASYDADEAIHTGETSVEELPAEAGKDIPAYSAYAYAGYGDMESWRFENMQLIMMNGQGSDLLFEEVGLGTYDQNAGWGNWNMSNYKPSLFGHKAYSQFGANSTLVQQAIADGYVVGLYVHGGKIPSTNSNKSSQTIVYSYYTAEDGTVMFKLICPRGDTSELNAGKVYGECTAAELDNAIQNFSSSSVRGLMYVVGEQEYDSSWQRLKARVELEDDLSAFTLKYGPKQVKLSADFIDNYKTFGKGGVIAYTLESESAADKMAGNDFHYDIEVNADGSLTIPEDLKAALEAGDSACVYVIRNDGITYTAELNADDSIAPVGPSPEDVADEDEPVVTDPEEDKPEEIKLNFSDVSSSAWYYSSVQYVVENGLMNGTSATTFAPMANTTRGQVVTTLWRMTGEPEPNGSNPFADVAAGSYYEKAITWAAENGIVTGVSATEFKPDNYITREQLATVLFRYAQFRGMAAVVLSENLWFNDAHQISAYAVPAMNWAVYAELVTGTGNGNVEPQSYANRAQVATILVRFSEKVK